MHALLKQSDIQNFMNWVRYANCVLVKAEGTFLNLFHRISILEIRFDFFKASLTKKIVLHDSTRHIKSKGGIVMICWLKIIYISDDTVIVKYSVPSR